MYIILNIIMKIYISFLRDSWYTLIAPGFSHITFQHNHESCNFWHFRAWPKVTRFMVVLKSYVGKTGAIYFILCSLKFGMFLHVPLPLEVKVQPIT